MKDRWINIAFDENELRPYREPTKQIDNKRIGNHGNMALLVLYCLTPTLWWRHTQIFASYILIEIITEKFHIFFAYTPQLWAIACDSPGFVLTTLI